MHSKRALDDTDVHLPDTISDSRDQLLHIIYYILGPPIIVEDTRALLVGFLSTRTLSFSAQDTPASSWRIGTRVRGEDVLPIRMMLLFRTGFSRDTPPWYSC